MAAGDLDRLVESATQLSDPGRGLEAVSALRRRIEDIERLQVERAIGSGWSWSRVAEALGVSKQAAHKKHASALRKPPAENGVIVTGAARLAVRRATEEARAMGARAVGTEHLLLGLIRDPGGPVAEAMGRLGAGPEDVRSAVQPTVGDDAGDGAVVISALARKVLEQALAETVQREHGHLGEEHLALALLRDEEGGAVRTLAALGIDCGRLRDELAEGAGVRALAEGARI